MILHLWQSTLFAAAAWTLTLVFRGHRARVRYWIWLAASCKFLIPLSLLQGLGSGIAARTAAPLAPHRVSVAMEHMLVPLEFAPTPLPQQSGVWRWLLPLLWASGSTVVLWSWARTARSPITCPSVHGLFRQRLLLPEPVRQRLTPEELNAIVAHERHHMRCRDNLTAAIHMLVEAAFWFHPLVWWIERRLIDERERACDEEVLRAGSAPDVYASGILKVCEFGIESRLACAAGVTGADLKRRIQSIVHWRGVERLRAWHRVLIALAAAGAIAVPILIGADRLAFEVASVKRFPDSPYDEVERKITPGPDGLTGRRQSVRDLIQWAYEGDHPAEIIGPASLDGVDYDIFAKAGRTVSISELREMLQTLLADRFKLSFHRETKTAGVYAVVVGPSGAKLKAVQKESTRQMFMRFENGIAGFDMVCNMARFAEVVTMFTDRHVVDETGLSGVYEIPLRVPVDDNPLKRLPPPGSIFQGFGATPGIFSAVEEFGLKLQSRKAPVERIVVDHLERPSEN